MTKVGERVAASLAHLGRRDFKWRLASIRLVWDHVCGASTSLIADWLEGASTKQVGVGGVKSLDDHEPKTKLEKNVLWFVLWFRPLFP